MKFKLLAQTTYKDDDGHDIEAAKIQCLYPLKNELNTLLRRMEEK